MSIPPDQPPSRHEFNQLIKRVEAMDKYGSRAMIRMAAQVTMIARDLADLTQAFRKQQERHEERRRARVIGHRWLIGTCIAAAGALVLVLTLLLQILGRIR